MKMFLGQYNPNVTEGSRIALPKRMREQIKGKQVVLTRGFEKCIFIYDAQDWQEQALRQINNSKEDNKGSKTRDLERYFYANAVETPIDSQGRLVLPSHLMEYAQIKGKTAVIGVGERIEVWDDSNWREHLEKISAQIETL